jgi:hypothetical protein
VSGLTGTRGPPGTRFNSRTVSSGCEAARQSRPGAGASRMRPGTARCLAGEPPSNAHIAAA